MPEYTIEVRDGERLLSTLYLCRNDDDQAKAQLQVEAEDYDNLRSLVLTGANGVVLGSAQGCG